MSEGAAKVLVVEDSETQALVLRQTLERAGYEVDWAASAEAALERLNGPLPDLLVADFHLPGMNGGELSRQIRLNGRTRALPVLMLTSARELDLERQGLESGADAYVPKSADPELMLVRLRALLRGPGLEESSAGAGRYKPFRAARVLVVHDSPTMRLRLEHLLAHEGYEVQGASSADDGLRLVREELDCIVLPASGVDFDGLAFCRLLHARRAAVALPFRIVVLSTTRDERDALAAFEAGADDVAPQGASDEVLRVRVRALMRRKLVSEENRRIEADLREREVAIARARAEAESAQARAAAADALARANAELEAANRQLKDTQSQLVQAAKMASLGELVAGIAHEINNPLAFIMGHQGTVERLVNGLRSDRAPDHPDAATLDKAHERLQSMRLGLKRIETLVQNLRKFSRLDEDDRQLIDVPDGIETVLALLAPKLGAIEVRRCYEANRSLEGSPALLNQVAMNIIANAADALEGHGVIEIRTRDGHGRYELEISDSGPGIADELRDRVFEPFFTTKPVGVGTGLGLAIAYRVIEAHNGSIAVDRGPLGGARFLISIPTSAER